MLQRRLTRALVFAALLAAAGCRNPAADLPDSFRDTYSGSGPQVFHVAAAGGYTFTYSLDLGAATREVYFVFTNTSTATRVNPTVLSPAMARGLEPSAAPAAARRERVPPAELSGPRGIRGLPEVAAFNENPGAFLPARPASRDATAPPPPLLDEVGDANGFKYDSAELASLIAATCRTTVTDPSSGRTLTIWVADDCWTSGGTTTYRVTQQMVDALAAKFLAAGEDNDVYDWVTNVFGAEWGAHSYSSLIAPDNQITILLYDIQGDDDEFLSAGGVVGFFWAKDNYRNTATFTYSNERVMFYLDAVMLACPEPLPGVWSLTDAWPTEVVATLAHEFQHMIDFYQKSVLRAKLAGMQTWLNELLSLNAEDIVADRILVDGPRGVAYSDYTAGSAANEAGRLPLFNYYDDYPIAYWPADPFDREAMLSYSVNYAFGAYLTRNYAGAPGGSAEFLRHVVQNGYTDYRALQFAAAQAGSADGFGTMLRRWGAAVLLSDDDVTAPEGYAYNTGSSVDSTLGSVTYRLGSANLYNYRYSWGAGPTQYLDGPYLYSAADTVIGPTSGQSPTSNIYYEVGTALTGLVEREVFMGTGVALTVVVK